MHGIKRRYDKVEKNMNDTELKEKILRLKELNTAMECRALLSGPQRSLRDAIIENRLPMQNERHMTDAELKERILKLQQLNTAMARRAYPVGPQHSLWDPVIENRVLLLSEREFIETHID